MVNFVASLPSNVKVHAFGISHKEVAAPLSQLGHLRLTQNRPGDAAQLFDEALCVVESSRACNASPRSAARILRVVLEFFPDGVEPPQKHLLGGPSA